MRMAMMLSPVASVRVTGWDGDGQVFECRSGKVRRRQYSDGTRRDGFWFYDDKSRERWKPVSSVNSNEPGSTPPASKAHNFLSRAGLACKMLYSEVQYPGVHNVLLPPCRPKYISGLSSERHVSLYAQTTMCRFTWRLCILWTFGFTVCVDPPGRLKKLMG